MEKRHPRFFTRSLRIGSKAAVFVGKENDTDTESTAKVEIKIGEKHTATLSMSERAFEEYLGNKDVTIPTVQEILRNTK
jgi:hypothetical protein